MVQLFIATVECITLTPFLFHRHSATRSRGVVVRKPEYRLSADIWHKTALSSAASKSVHSEITCTTMFVYYKHVYISYIAKEVYIARVNQPA